jgi:hypothetical protein
VSSAATTAAGIYDYAFNPSVITVNAGDTVTWTNYGFTVHTVTSNTFLWDSGPIYPGSSYSRVFDTPGVFGFYDVFYPAFMSGTVQVLGSLSPTPTGTPQPAFLGGKSFSVTSGNSQLTWNGNGIQTAYYVARWNPGGTATVIASPPPSAISYTDPGPLTSYAYCYLLVSSAPPNLFGLSDLLCRFPGGQNGVAPGNFTLRLNQTQTATMNWTTPSTSFTDYLLTIVPLDGSAATSQVLSSSQTAFSHPTGGKPTCYILATRSGSTVIGNTDALCAVPGISNLGATAAQIAGSNVNSLDRALEALPRALHK